ncbi:MAG: diguanylate cyclase [Phycisphaerae bacterium]
MFVPHVGEIKQLNNDTDQLFDIGENVTVADAAKIMSYNHVGCLTVFDENRKFVGIITERDMLSKVLAKSFSPKNVLVSDIMTSAVLSCTPQTSITEAESIMDEHKIRHLPIVENGKAVAMLSSRDLIAYRLKSNKDMQVAAEQLAMLPTGLKNLEPDDVASLAVHEVPKSFAAQNAVLCIANKNRSKPFVYANNCNAPHKQLINEAHTDIPQDIRIQIDTACSGCSEQGCALTKLVIPLSVNTEQDETFSGFLCMCRPTEPDEKPDNSQLYKASLLRQVLNINLTNAMLYKNYIDARHDSETDPLTGVGTRRFLENVLKAECSRSARFSRTFCVAIIDVDHFKKINDTAGHAAGDETLKNIAELISKNLRETDMIVARYGGDEFVLVMPETPIEGGHALLERIRRQAGNISIPSLGSLTISSGLAEWNPEPADTPESIMQRADNALYKAKRNGRNQVIAEMLENAAV